MRLRNELCVAGGVWLLGLAGGAVVGAGNAPNGPVHAEPSPPAQVPSPPRLFLQIAARNVTVFVILLTGLFTAGVSATLLLAWNGIGLGLLVGAAWSAGRDAVVLAALLVPHGVAETVALAIAGAVGMRGWRIARRALRTGDPGLGHELVGLGRPIGFGMLVLLCAAAIESTVTRAILLGALRVG